MATRRAAGKARKRTRRSAASSEISPSSSKTRRRKPQKKAVAFRQPLPADERVLALDVSSKCVGWSIFDNGQLTQHGRYLQQGDKHGEKLSTFRTWVLAMLAEFRPTHLIYEAPYSGRMRNTFGILSRYAGIVELCHFEHFQCEIPGPDAVPAHLVKKAISAKKGKSHEENKKIVTLLVNQAFGLSLKYKEHDTTKKTSQDDEADAIALNWAWHNLYRTASEDE